MLQVTKFVARPLSLIAAELIWEVQPSTEDTHLYDFEILRSESPEGPFDSITPKFKDKFYFIDNQMPQYLHGRYIFYKLKIWNGEEYTETVTRLGGFRNPIALEIARKHRIVLKNIMGLKVYVFPVRTFGTFCSCYDQVLHRSMANRCLACFNTGFAGGYLTPVESYAMIIPNVNVQEIPKGGGVPVEVGTAVIRFGNFPYLKSGDVIYNPISNERWRIVNVTPSTLAGFTISQVCTCSFIDPSDVVHELKVDVDVFTLVEPIGLVEPRKTF